MAAWLTPQRLEDAARVLRGVALVLGRAAADSPALKRAGAADYERAVAVTAELLSAHAQRARWGAGHSSQPTDPSQQAEAQFSAPPARPQAGSVWPPAAAPLLADVHRGTHATGAAAAAAGSAGPVQGQHFGAPSSQLPTAWARPEASHKGGSTRGATSSDGAVHAAVAHDASWSNQPSPTSSRSTVASTSQHEHGAVSDGAGSSSSSSSSSRSHPMAAVGGLQSADSRMAHLQSGVDAELSLASASSSAPTHTVGSPPSEASQQQQDAAAAPEVIDSWPSAAESVYTAAEQSDATPAHLLGPAATGTAAAAAAARSLASEPPTSTQGATAEAAAAAAGGAEAVATPPRRVLRERAVPSSQLGRALGFAGMGASLLLGTLKDNLMNSLGAGPAEQQAAAAAAGKDTDGHPTTATSGSSAGAGVPVYSNFITQSNAERLANALCRMRGAALKIGQMLSIQDESVLPPQIQSALERVRAGADVMPRRQLEKQLVGQLGRDWASGLSSFDWEPRAAASIGQVHAAVLLDGRQVAMKVQYPGVARSIESDVDNLMRLVSLANILPRGLFVDSAVKVAKKELALECDYRYEAAAQARFKALVEADPELAPHFHVPGVIPALSSDAVITTEWVNGVTIDKVAGLGQEVRDRVGTQLLRLTLRELFHWGYMQTDPNWGNFLYDGDTGRLNLIDFGAAREYPPAFVTDYLAMVAACAERDRAGVIAQSQKLGFLTGDESEVMLAAHSEAGFVVGIPFATPGTYDFGTHSGLTPRVAELGAVMLKHRLTPPPEESYSLHRKLSGAFLACMKLRARVPCRQLFLRTYEQRTAAKAARRMAAQHSADRDQQREEQLSQAEQVQVAGM